MDASVAPGDRHFAIYEGRHTPVTHDFAAMAGPRVHARGGWRFAEELGMSCRSTLQAEQRMTVSAETAIRDTDTAIPVSFELSQSRWVLTIHLPGSDRMSHHIVKADKM
jgi:hypothetical protein